MADVLAWFQSNLVIILGVIVALDHALAAIPAIGANSTFQLISGWLVSIAKMLGYSGS